MKKIKLLIPTIAIGLPAVLVPVTSCGQDNHIVEPSEAQKKVETKNGEQKATFTFDLTTEAKSSDIYDVQVTQTNSYNLTVENISASNKTLKFDVRITDELVHTGSVSVNFDVLITMSNSSHEKQWDKTISGCTLNFVPGVLTKLHLNIGSTLEYGDTSDAVQITDWEPKAANINASKTTIRSSATDIIEITQDNKLHAVGGLGFANIIVTATDSLGRTYDETTKVTITNTVTTLEISGTHNIDTEATSQYSFTVKDQDYRDQTKYCDWSVTDLEGNTTDRVSISTEGKLTINATGKEKGGSFKIISKLKTTNEDIKAEFEIELGTYSKITLNNDGTSWKCPDSVTTLSGDLLFPTRIWVSDQFKTINSIASSGFAGRDGELDRVYISSNITANGIDNQAFMRTQIKSIVVDENNTNLTSGSINCVMNTAKTKVILGCKNTSTLPSTVVEIGANAFAGVAFDYTSSTGPLFNFKYIKYIRINAFLYSNIQTVALPDCLETIENYAFKDCSSLTNITIADASTPTSRANLTIGESAFDGCNFATILLPLHTASIGSKAFYNNSALSGQEGNVWFNAEFDYQVQWYYKNDNNVLCFLQANAGTDGSAGSYNKQFFTSSFKTVTRYGDDRMFDYSGSASNWTIWKGTQSPETLILPQLLGRPNQSATAISTIKDFKGLASTKTIDLSGSVCTTINANAFQGCTVLTSIIFDKELTTLNDAILSGCTSLSLIDLTAFKTVPSWTITTSFDNINSTAATKTVKVASGTKTDWETRFATIWASMSTDGWTIEEAQ